MFRTKADVDRHVSDILLKIHNDNEKKLRGFTFARLYNQVKDFETAKKYLSGYLSVRDHHAPSHKLMAQLHEATGNFEKSLQCYKRSLEIDSNQRDIILKICELYCKLSVDHETARYWADRAEQFFPHHEVVFKLRECIISGEGEPDWQEHEKLITTELATQPYNLNLRTKLLHLYLKMERVKEAYVHATKVEKKKPFPNNKEWYYLLVDIFEAYQNESGQELDSNFYIMFLSALDHLVYLTLAEPHALPEKPSSHTSSNVDEAAAVLLQFDQNLKKAVNKDLTNGAWLYFLHHMKGQLYFHLGTLLLKRAKKEQGNWKQACQVGTALFLTGYSFKPANLLQEIWFSQMEEQQQLFTKFFQQGSLRTSFIGHTVLALCKEDKNKWLQKIKHNVCLPQVQERTFRQLFSCTDQKINSSESYFLNDTTFVNIDLTFPILTALQEYDTAAFKFCPHSLHHLIWLQLHKDHAKDPTYRENLSEAFKGLQYSNSNLSKGNVESLCLLDLEAFLLATLYTTNSLLEQKSAVINNKNGTTALSVPPDVAEHLCSPDQGNWWKAAHSLVSCGVKMKLGEQRRILQHGLEVIRGIGNHGLEVQLVVHLARAFADQAAALSPDSAGTIKSPSEEMSSSKVSALESRAMHYWSIVLNMLEKLELNQNLPFPEDDIFVGISAALYKEEISMLREEGKLYLACRYMNSGKLESAIEVLERLMSPYASYYLAVTYKKMALQESTVAVAKTALLNKARDALFMTMDRIQSDHTHPLNRDIHLEIKDVESEIKNSGSYSNANETFESEDSDDYDTADDYHTADDYDTADASFPTSSKNGTPASAKPQRITNHSTPRPSASFMNSRNKHSNSIRHVHVQTSPERLDAQIRSLASTQTTLISTMLEQQRSLLDFNEAIIEQLKANTDVVIQLKALLQGSPTSTMHGVTPVASTETFSFKTAITSPDTPQLYRSRKDSEACSDTDVAREVMGDFKPAIPLPAEIVVETGEEDEIVLFEDRAKLFRFVDREWKERGIGIVKILKHKDTGNTRLLMRRDRVLKVCLNHYLKKDMEFAWKGDKSLTWTAMDFSENEPCPEQFAIRFKTVELAQQFHNIVSSTMKDLPSTEGDVVTTTSTSSSVSTSESAPSAIGTQSFAQKISAFSFTLENESPKSTFGLSSRFGTNSPGKAHPPDATSTSPAVDFKSSFNTSIQDSDDIEFVYELKATQEQVAKALALKLLYIRK